MTCTAKLMCFHTDLAQALVALRAWAAPFSGPHERISQPVEEDGFSLSFDDQVRVSLLPYPDYLQISIFVTTVSAEHLAHLEACFDRVVADSGTLGAVLYRDGAYRCLPRFFGNGWVVRAQLHAENLERVFRDQQVLTRGFDRVEPRPDGRFLLVRAEGVVERVAVREALEEGAWAMTRGLKQGRLKVTISSILKDEQAIHFRGSAALEPVGYLPEERCFEFSCLLGPEAPEIRGWEFCQAAQMLRSGSFEGQALERVRVVFLEAAHAHAEKRSLLELGLEVWCYTEAGELRRLED